MLRLIPVVLITVFSFSALARVSMEEKRTRVRILERLSKAIPALHIEGYHRELKYEEQNLSLSERAENEAQLVAEKIKQQVVTSFEKAKEETGDTEEAKNRVREAIDRDLELADPGIRDSFQEIAYKALEDVSTGVISSEDNFDPLSKYMLTEVKERSNYLNIEMIDGGAGSSGPAGKDGKDAERLSYNNKAELLESLSSDRSNTRWFNAGGTMTNSAIQKRADANVSYTLKINFLGADLSGGPNISFHRHYESRVMIMTEGLEPGININGDFNFTKHDRSGNVVKKNGKPEKRFMAFFCEVSLNFNTEYSGSGNFSIMGVGGGTSFGARFANDVTMTSRRILIPETVGNQRVTLPALQRLCMNDFLNARINKRLTVKDSLNIQMRNVIASLRFSHPKTKCVRDAQCMGWFNRGMRGVVGKAAIPRCVEEPKEKYFSCEVRSVVNQKCPVYQNGKHTSDGQFEYKCDNGLYCKIVKEGGWFKSLNVFDYAEGRCMPRARR